MKKVLPIYFMFSVLIAMCVYVAQKLDFKLPEIIDFYLNDFLIMPILLTISLVILRWSRNNKNYQIPIWVILYICGVYAFLYEYVLPKFNPRYTADIIDVVLYFISGFLFFTLQNFYNVNKT